MAKVFSSFYTYFIHRMILWEFKNCSFLLVVYYTYFPPAFKKFSSCKNNPTNLKSQYSVIYHISNIDHLR